MTAPFLDITAFTAEYQGLLSAGETTTATRLLQVTSDGIRTLKPDVDVNAAQQVVFEVVRENIKYGDMGPLLKFDNITDRRQESGMFDAATKALSDWLTGRQKRLLGLSAKAAPRGHFLKCDY